MKWLNRIRGRQLLKAAKTARVRRDLARRMGWFNEADVHEARAKAYETKAAKLEAAA